MNAKRLLKLADFLEKLPPARFDYATWAGEDWKGRADLSCGTTACALGWATTIPELKRAGLRLVKSRDEGPYVALGRHRERHEIGGDIDGMATSLMAAVRVFGIAYADAFYLFTPKYGTRELGACARPKAVAAHIRAFVARGGMPESR